MKSQPEYKVRRLAVFVGYGHPEPAPAWSRVTHHRKADDPNTVVRLQAVARPAELQRAA